MDDGDRVLLVLAVVIIGAVIRGIFYAIGSPAERAAKELARDRAIAVHHSQRDEAARTCEARAMQLIDEFPTLGDFEIATLMHDELVNMRCQYPVYFEWVTPVNVGRMRRTLAVGNIRAQRNRG